MAKAKKKSEGEPRAVIEINDENLKEFSSGGQVFVLEAGDPGSEPSAPAAVEVQNAEKESGLTEPGTSDPAAIPTTSPGADRTRISESAPEAERELFWRQSVSELRTSLRRGIDDLRRLELESSILRQQFYSEADPFVRDSEIKPRWDRSLDQLNVLRKRAKEDHDALTSLLAEAKKAGVSAAWIGSDDDSKLIEEALRLINSGAPPKQ